MTDVCYIFGLALAELFGLPEYKHPEELCDRGSYYRGQYMVCLEWPQERAEVWVRDSITGNGWLELVYLRQDPGHSEVLPLEVLPLEPADPNSIATAEEFVQRLLWS